MQVVFVMKRMAYAAGLTEGVRHSVDSDAFEAQEAAELQRLEFIHGRSHRASTITELQSTPRNLQLTDISGGLNGGGGGGGGHSHSHVPGLNGDGSFHTLTSGDRSVSSFGLDSARMSKHQSKFSMVPDV